MDFLFERTTIRQLWEDVVKECDSRWIAEKRSYKCSFHCYFPAFKIKVKHIKWLYHAAGLDKAVDRAPFTLRPGSLQHLI